MGDATVSAAEKSGDDPTAPESSPPGRHSTPTALTRLLAARTFTTSPDISRNGSYIDGNPNLTRQAADSANSSTHSLHDHLYTRGLLEGKHSDIAVIAFGHRYNLHRLILDRAAFFTTALSGPWIESQAREIVLHPEEIDPTITQKSFELALKRLYGCDIRAEEDAEAVGLFATGCWLEMPDLVDAAVESILRQMDASTLAPLIRLVTHNYYGRAGERVLASAKAMLCRDGWEMPVRYWDEVPGEVVREIVGGDGFYVPGEWERWGLAKRLLDRRLRQKAVEHGLAAASVRGSIPQAPELLRRQSLRTLHARSASIESAGSMGEDVWTSIYTDPDIEPLLVLMDHGIHYVHLDFERLQYIRQAKDVFGLSILPEHVITNSLWQQMELRQRVVNARENDLELGLSHAADVQTPITAVRTPSSSATTLPAQQSKGKQREGTAEASVQDEDDAYEDAFTRPRKFWIPSADCNIVMGGNAEPVITTNATSNFLRLSSGLPAGIDITDVLWASNFAGPSPSRAADRNRIGRMPNTNIGAEDGLAQPRPVAYSNIPPFRFAAEFPNPRGLKEKKRVYSRTVFYAGSHWNIYIQKVRSQKNPQLGVYLHRAKERDTDDMSDSNPATAARLQTPSTVDERIGLLEREMLLRSGSDGRRAMGGRRSIPTRHGDREADDGSMAAYRRNVYTTGEDNVLDTSFTAYESGSEETEDEELAAASGSRLEPPRHAATNFLDDQPSTSTAPSLTHFPPPTSTAADTTAPVNPNAPRPHAVATTASATNPPFHAKRIPTLPAYTDARPTIKTYFKIYSPSRGGRLLSVYESAPDKFDYSQSWGWKSSTLMLDEGFSHLNNATASMPGVPAEGIAGISVSAVGGGEDGGVGGDGGLAGEVERERERERERRRRKEGCLRFMVVIGNL